MCFSCRMPFSWDNCLRMANYYDIDDIITEEEVEWSDHFFWSLYSHPFFAGKYIILKCCCVWLQPISVIFQKAVNGVGIDPSSEQNCVCFSKFWKSLNGFHNWLKCIEGLLWVFFLFYSGWTGIEGRAPLLACLWVVPEKCSSGTCSSMFRREVRN